MDLRECPLHSAVTLDSVDVADDDRARLRTLGVREGAVVHVVNRSAFGAGVLALGADRIALDGATCARIRVLPPPEPAATAARPSPAGAAARPGAPTVAS